MVITGRSIGTTPASHQWYLIGAVVLCAASGVALTVAPLSTAAAIVAAVAAVTLARSGSLAWSALLLVLGGSLVLGYGFANVGVPTPWIPIPITELLLLALLWAVAARPFMQRIPASFALAACFLGFAGIRLLVDYPVWGRDAVRDFTFPLELSFLLVGYWAAVTFGIPRLVRPLGWIFLACVLYSLLYPWRDELAAVSPTVGLQRPVPLLGSYSAAGPAAAAALFYFALVRPFGRLSLIPAGAAIAVILMVQSRGLYLAIPLAATVTGLIARRSNGVASRLAAGLLVGVVAAFGVMAFAPAGRLGPVTPSFATSQLATLRGDAGPLAGSISHRREWMESVLQTVEEQPVGWLIGVGLGPDLAGGFRTDQDAAVRKPHNDYLETYARFGIAGLGLFLAAIGLALFQVSRAARNASLGEAPFLWWVFAMSLVFLMIAATQPLLAFPYGTVPLFFALGVGVGRATKRQDDAGAS